MIKEYEENILFNNLHITSGVYRSHAEGLRSGTVGSLISWGYGCCRGAAVGGSGSRIQEVQAGLVEWRCGLARGFSGCPGSTPGQSTPRGASAMTSAQQRWKWTRGQRPGSGSTFVTRRDTITRLTRADHTGEKVSPKENSRCSIHTGGTHHWPAADQLVSVMQGRCI